MANMNQNDPNKPAPGTGGDNKPEIQPDFTPSERQQPKAK